MADRVEVELKGADELLVKLKTVSSDMQLKGGRFALRKAGEVVRLAVEGEAMKLNRESTREAIFRNVRMRFSPRAFQRTGNLAFRVGFLGGALSRKQNEANPGGDTWYWRLLEFGTSQMPAKPFVRPAVERSRGRVMAEFIIQYRKALDRALRRAAREKATAGKK